jgi:hypothetical protein
MRLPRPRSPEAPLAHPPTGWMPYGLQTIRQQPADLSGDEPSVALTCCLRLREGGVAGSSHSHVWRDLGVRLGSDAIDLLQFLDPAEPLVLLPPGENRLGGDRPDSRQLF